MSQDLQNKVNELSKLRELFKKQVTPELRAQIPKKKEELKELVQEIVKGIENI